MGFINQFIITCNWGAHMVSIGEGFLLLTCSPGIIDDYCILTVRGNLNIGLGWIIYDFIW